MNPNDQKQVDPSQPNSGQIKSKDVNIGGKETTMVGEVSENKADAAIQEQPKVPEEVLFQWEAPEFVYTHKPAGWYIGIFAFFIGLMALAAWQRQWISIGLLAIVAVALAVWANRKPRTLLYKVTNYGVEVESKKYLYDSFRAFYEFKDYNQPTLDLIPTKRFGTLVSLPLATPDAEEIQETIGHMVPKTDHNEDIVDKLFRRLRF